jgi:PAS domain-containing protein
VRSTEREKSGRAFHEMNAAEDKYPAITDGIPTMAWSSLPDGTVEFLNGRWLDYTGSRSTGQVAGGGTRLFSPMIAAHWEIEAEHCSLW